MYSGRRGFLHSLFISPAVAKERLEQIENDQKQKLEDERIRQVIKAQQAGIKPEDLKPRCNVCDAVLINGKCQFTKKCHFCTSKLIEQNVEVHAQFGIDPVYTHVVEDKCVICGNAPDMPIMAYSGSAIITTLSYASLYRTFSS